MRRSGAVHRRAVTIVAGRAPELVGVVLAEEQLALGVGLPRVRLILEAGLVDACMTGRAAVHARDRLVERVLVEVVQHHLLDLRDLRLPLVLDEGRRQRRTGERPGGTVSSLCCSSSRFVVVFASAFSAFLAAACLALIWLRRSSMCPCDSA